MEGAVGVESIVGAGSTFWIELPITEKQIRRESQKEINEKLTAMESKLLPNTGTILYVEDNVQNAELVDEIIRNYRPGIKLITSIYGNTAVTLATEHKPGLILLDLDLPDMEGIEVLINLMADESIKSIPVVIISADATQHQIEKLMSAGAKDYLTKPLDINLFLQTVDVWTRGSKNQEIVP
jgi:CheY-like chemotaxis protein